VFSFDFDSKFTINIEQSAVERFGVGMGNIHVREIKLFGKLEKMKGHEATFDWYTTLAYSARGIPVG